MALQAALKGRGPLDKNASGGALLSFLFRADGGIVKLYQLSHIADGGHVRGPGTSRLDSLLAARSDGGICRQRPCHRSDAFASGGHQSGKASRLNIIRVVGGGKSGGTTLSVGNINVNVQSTGSSGDPAKDNDHAKNMGKEVGKAIDQHMTDWAINQMRPGGLLAGRR